MYGGKRHITIDVCYSKDGSAAWTAGIVFERCSDEIPAVKAVRMFKNPAPYIPGLFYKREL